MSNKSELPKSITSIIDAEAQKTALVDMLPFFKFTAEMQFIKFQALKKAGFTIPESLELCKGGLFVDTNISPPKKKE